MPDFPSPVVTYRKAKLRVAEVFFDGRGADAVDVVRYKFHACPVPGGPHFTRSGSTWRIARNLYFRE